MGGIQRDRRSAPTLHDVAEAAGVSLATASRALNGSARKVKEEYRARVLAAATRLNYSPNTSAQAVVRGRTNAIGIVVSDITDPYFSAVAAGVFRAAESAGLIATIAVSERRPEKELQIVAALRGQRPRGLVMIGSRFADAGLTERLERELRAFEAEGGRVALVSQEGLPFSTVAFDNSTAARSLAERLVGLGYRSFTVMSGPPELITARDRSAGFIGGLRDAGVPDERIDLISGDFTRDGGYAAAGEFLGRLPRSELIFAANDVMAVGAMARLREAGFELPAGVAVAGFDDITTLRDVTPALTTVRLPLAQSGETAVALILADEEDRVEPAVVRLPGQIVVRSSTPERSR
jgi:LacI family transcriptional regulator